MFDERARKKSAPDRRQIGPDCLAKRRKIWSFGNRADGIGERCACGGMALDNLTVGGFWASGVRGVRPPLLISCVDDIPRRYGHGRGRCGRTKRRGACFAPVTIIVRLKCKHACQSRTAQRRKRKGRARFQRFPGNGRRERRGAASNQRRVRSADGEGER